MDTTMLASKVLTDLGKKVLKDMDLCAILCNLKEPYAPLNLVSIAF